MSLCEEDAPSPVEDMEIIQKESQESHQFGGSMDMGDGDEDEDEARNSADEEDLQQEHDSDIELTIEQTPEFNDDIFANDFIADLQEAIESTTDEGELWEERSEDLRSYEGIGRPGSRKDPPETPDQLSLGRTAGSNGAEENVEGREIENTSDPAGQNSADKTSNDNRSIGMMIAHNILKRVHGKETEKDLYKDYATQYSWTGHCIWNTTDAAML